jgi:hypothetical protein
MDGLDFALAPIRAARVAGTLVNSAGEAVAGQRVNLDRIARTVGGGLFYAQFAGNTTSGRDGTFELRGLAPGEYMVYSGSRETEEARMQIFVAGADLQGLTLMPRRPAVVTGAVVTDTGEAPDFAAPRVRVAPFAVDELLPVWGSPSAQPLRADWTFRFTAIQGRFLFRTVGLPDGWMLKAVRIGDRDITDAPIEITPGDSELKGLQMVIGRANARLTGRVIDARGAPRPDSTVVVFSARPEHWMPGTRFVQAIRPGNDGRFTVGSLPAGRYHAAVRDFVLDGAWEDPEFLRSLTLGSLAFELQEGKTEAITLTLEPQP